MNRHRHIARSRWVLLAICAVACVACFAMVRRFPAPQANAATFSALAAERDRLRSNTDAVRDELRQKAQDATSPEWTDGRIAELQGRLGPAWQWTVEPRTAAPERRAVVRAVALELTRWPAYLTALEAIEQQPGIVVERIDFAAEGTGSARKFVRVVFTLRLLRPRARTPGNKERAAALSARSLFRGQWRRPGGERSRVFFSARPAVRLRLPTGLRSGENARPFLRGPLTA
jgi:hypothetical protein